MHRAVERLVREAADDASAGRRTENMQMVVNLLSRYRRIRDGFDASYYDVDLVRVLGAEPAAADLSGSDVVEIVTTLHSALATSPSGLSFLSAAASTPEEAAVIPLLVDLTDRMWETPTDAIEGPLFALGLAMDDPAARQVIDRWAGREDAWGHYARSILSRYSTRKEH